jgi:DNA-binding LacI/PurR family transcriptional regulator
MGMGVVARATIRDVARRAGCSTATVSRVLNGVGPASEAARTRVLEAAQALGFRFNEIGRSLQAQRSRTLGVIVPTVANPVFAEAIDGIQDTARARGYQLLLACSNYDPNEELQSLSMLLAKQVDGLVMTVSNADDSAAIDAVRRAQVPFVLVFNQPCTAVPAVAVDNFAAAREVGARLLALGHGNAAFVAGRFRMSDRSRQRYDGVCAAYAQAGAPQPELLEVDYLLLDHRDTLAALLERRPETSALFCSNDMLALSAIGALREFALRVPEDLSVVGFDGIALSTAVSPRLATIATPCAAMGRTAAGRVIDGIEGILQIPAETLILPHEFRPGGSLAAARTVSPARGLPPAQRHARQTLES